MIRRTRRFRWARISHGYNFAVIPVQSEVEIILGRLGVPGDRRPEPVPPLSQCISLRRPWGMVVQGPGACQSETQDLASKVKMIEKHNGL